MSYPTYDDLPMAAKDLFDDTWEQLDQGLHRGFALVLRQRLEAITACGSAEWAFAQVAGPVLDREAQERDAAAADELAAIWALETPTADDVGRAIELLETLFDCP
jgi:hypothetical protein